MRPNVWTPSGGWFPDPKGWKGNLGKAYLGLFVVGSAIFYTSASLEVRPFTSIVEYVPGVPDRLVHVVMTGVVEHFTAQAH